MEKAVVLPSGVPRLRRRAICSQRHDNLGWSAGAAYAVGPYSFGIRSNDADYLELMKAWVPFVAKPVDLRDVDTLISVRLGAPSKRRGVTNFHVVYSAWRAEGKTTDKTDLKGLAQFWVLSSCVDLAGLVGQLGLTAHWEGKVTLFCGLSEGALTTLETKLRGAGAQIMSRDYNLLLANGAILPYQIKQKETMVFDVERAYVVGRPDGPSSYTKGEAAVALFQRSFGLSHQERLAYWGEFVKKCDVQPISMEQLDARLLTKA